MITTAIELSITAIYIYLKVRLCRIYETAASLYTELNGQGMLLLSVALESSQSNQAIAVFSLTLGFSVSFAYAWAIRGKAHSAPPYTTPSSSDRY